jgi:thiamine-phosphate pyrophosphorylase
MVQTSVIRVLDASLNRAAEGLRVVEDYARLVLDDPFLTGQTKALRHDLTTASEAIPSADRHAARDTLADVGTIISTAEESQRGDAWDVCAASLKRTAQSLRSLEEYGKLVSPDFAGQCESLRYRLYTLEKAIDIGRSSRDRLEGVTLCVLIDGGKTPDDFTRLAQSLVEAGVGMIQLRDKRLDDRELIARARTLTSLIRRQPSAPPEVRIAVDSDAKKPPAEPGAARASRNPTLCIINDRADIAAAVGADGVHLGQEDLSVKDARAIVGPRMLIGVSTHNIAQARVAVLDGANYLGAGPTFASHTKAFEGFAGLDYLHEAANEIRLPTFAIGGISTGNLADVLATGVTRVAVSSAVTAAADPACAARELLGMLTAETPRDERPPFAIPIGLALDS